MKAGAAHPAEAMRREDCDTMKVWDLLIAIPKVGRVKANRILARERISPSKTLGGLSSRQRVALLGYLGR